VFVDEPALEYLAAFADEFLVHGVDVEGKRCNCGIIIKSSFY
jgi:phosphoribosylformimino-5-aminoimidazole carboxamide ribotide isomerase